MLAGPHRKRGTKNFISCLRCGVHMKDTGPNRKYCDACNVALKRDRDRVRFHNRWLRVKALG